MKEINEVIQSLLQYLIHWKILICFVLAGTIVAMTIFISTFLP